MARQVFQQHPLYDIAYRLYVRDALSVASISARIEIPERTLYAWKKKGGWDEDRDRYSRSEVALISALDTAAKELSKNLESPDKAVLVEAITLLDKITSIRARIDRQVDRLPVLLELIESLSEFMRREAGEVLKRELPGLLRRWSTGVLRQGKEAR